MATPRVIARLHGGLGNQLFQYAAGRAVALAGSAELVLDARLFTPDTAFGYELDHFAIVGRPGLLSELPPDKTTPLRYGLWRLFGRAPRFRRERGLAFDPGVLDARPDVYLHGYFQSERYFKPIEAAIRSELTFRAAPTLANAAMAARIAKTHAVSLHVRRGDYVASARARATHGAPALSFYARALDHIRGERAPEPVVFVFSDNPAWAADHLELDAETVFVSLNNGRTAHEDLRLMSLCRDHIIANSTFSWWGAWLDARPDKIVVAPDRWFASDRLRNPDICPPSWVRIGD